jgi:ribosome-associated protein
MNKHQAGRSQDLGRSSGNEEGGERIRLGQFLKLAGVVQTGGEGKALIAEGAVKVNGEPCWQRGHHLDPEDVVEMDGRKYLVSDFIRG